MELDAYMVEQIAAICRRAHSEHATITKEVMTMVYAEVTEVVNNIRAKIEAGIGILPPMPSVAVKLIEGQLRVSVDTQDWDDLEAEEGEEE